MRQYFYLIAHVIDDSILIPDKIFLQEHDAIKWGKVLATKIPEYLVYLYKQEISRTSTLKCIKQLLPYK